MAKVQRLVGIDFGTSTSIVKVKRYEGDSPVGDSHVSGSVTFGNGESDSKAVTAVRVNREGPPTCGAEALDPLPGSTIHQEFKMDLESPDREKRRQAMERTEDYFHYLYNWYDHQRSDLGAIDDEERTLVSYPVKWRQEAREYLLKTARNAGFQNVSGMDEPTAALYATLCRKMSEIDQQGLLRAGESGYMLLVDMGAGTTDLAVCRYRVKDSGPVIRVDQIENEIIAAWPMDSRASTFGGREVDRVLEEYIINYLESCGFPAENAVQAVCGNGNSSTAAKRWKETTVSKVLNDGKRVESCAFVAPFMMFLPQAKPFPSFGRREFEIMLGEKLEQFKGLVAGCLMQASQAEPELLAKKLDLVILTGGHSSWYFVEELINGAMPGLGLPQLERVQRERSRVIRLTNPQETVALGLVYSQLPFHVAAVKSDGLNESEQASAATAENGLTGVKRTVKAAKDTAAALVDTVHAAGQLGKAAAEAVKKAAKSQPAGGAAAVRMPEKWPTNDQLALSVKEFIGSYDQTVIQQITRGYVNKLRETMDVPLNEEVLLIRDDTLLGSGKNGFVFCTSGIICKPLLEKKTFVSWLSFATGELLPYEESTGGCGFRDSAGFTRPVTYCTKGTVNRELHRFLGALQDFLRARHGLKAIPQQPALSAVGDVSEEQLAASAKAFIECYDQSVLKKITRGKSEDMANCIGIPAGTEFYVHHDDSMFESGKTGFAITDRGFYCRKTSRTGFTDWRTFFAGVLEFDPADGYMLRRYNAFDNTREDLAYSVISRFSDPFVFISHLHAYMRSLYT